MATSGVEVVVRTSHPEVVALMTEEDEEDEEDEEPEEEAEEELREVGTATEEVQARGETAGLGSLEGRRRGSRPQLRV